MRVRSIQPTCSSDFVLVRPAVLLVRLTYAGEAVYEYVASLNRGPQRAWIAEHLRSTPLPAGEWGCSFSVGSAQAQARFVSAGPTGTVIGASACTGSNTLTLLNGRTRVCRADESTLPHRAIDEIACSAAIVHATGRSAQVHLFHGPNEVARPRRREIRDPIWIASGAFTAQNEIRRFPAGDYSCRFTLDGTVVAEVPYRVEAS